MRGKVKKLYVISGLVIIVLCFAFWIIWHFNIRTNYTLGVNAVHINAEEANCPIVDIYDWDDNFLTPEITFYDDSGTYDIEELEYRMGLFEPYFYYKNIVDDYSGDWMSCEIISYNRKNIILRYYGTNNEYEFDDVWRLDISNVREGENAVIYLNENKYERNNFQ